jgi:hypothetical protein
MMAAARGRGSWGRATATVGAAEAAGGRRTSRGDGAQMGARGQRQLAVGAAGQPWRRRTAIAAATAAARAEAWGKARLQQQPSGCLASAGSSHSGGQQVEMDDGVRESDG